MNKEQTELILTAICSNDLNLIKEFVSKFKNSKEFMFASSLFFSDKFE